MKLTSKLLLFAAALACLLPGGFVQPAKEQRRLHHYVGTYTRPNKSKGIYAWRFQPSTGKLTPIGLVGETISPSFLAVHPNHRFLYAVNEISNYEGKKAGSVSSFAMDTKTGQLRLLNTVSTQARRRPCHLAVDPSGKWLYVANYGGRQCGRISGAPDGSLGEASAFVQHAGSSVNKSRQAGPACALAVFSPGRQDAVRERSRARRDSVLQGRRADAERSAVRKDCAGRPGRGTWHSRRTASSRM